MTATLINPTDLRGVRDAVLDSAGTLAVAGAGTAANWAGALGPTDAVLDLRALNGVITHNPGDMTVSVRAGTPLRDLNAELAGHGQHVALDAARVADGATVGGLLATGDAGPGALVHGSLRDLVIGVTLVLADGTVARSGGHVIKNVAGYDLAKLVHGAYGTLAVVAEVVLRLHPLPQAVATLVLPCALEEAAEHAARILGGPYEPAALEWVSDPGALLVRIEGTEAALPERVERLRELLGPAADVADAPASAASPSGRRAARSSAPAGGERRPSGSRTGRHGSGRQRGIGRGRAVGRLASGAARRRRGGAARLLPRRAAPQPRSVGRGHERSGGHTSGRRGSVGRARAADPRDARRRRAPDRGAALPAPGCARRAGRPVGHRGPRHRRRHRRAARRPGRGRRGAHGRARRGRAPPCCAAAPSASTAPPGGRRRPRSPCSAPSRTSSTPHGRFGPGRLAPWLTEGAP